MNSYIKRPTFASDSDSDPCPDPFQYVPLWRSQTQEVKKKVDKRNAVTTKKDVITGRKKEVVKDGAVVKRPINVWKGNTGVMKAKSAGKMEVVTGGTMVRKEPPIKNGHALKIRKSNKAKSEKVDKARSDIIAKAKEDIIAKAKEDIIKAKEDLEKAIKAVVKATNTATNVVVKATNAVEKANKTLDGIIKLYG